MPDQDTFIPKQDRRRQAECPHCSNRVAMSLRNLRWIHPELKNPGPIQMPGQHVEEQVWSCDFCDMAVVELYSVDRLPSKPKNVRVAGEHKWTLISRVWPAQEPRPLSPDAPDKVRDLFLEAGRAEAVGAFRLAGVGYRSVVEEICKERGAAGRNLHAMISDLARLNVSQSVIDGFHEARLLGNDSVHNGLEYAPDEVADVAGLIEEAVLILYVQPAERQRMAAARLARRTAHGAGAGSPQPSAP
ncbi:hypothetical protein AQI88_29580 [Streptomyces cellostaticus]|uniref:DUF4145 domain-containing protein n=1 Tax=Streptomyces cellostaticus TaxID=67285 RepID=A0A117PUM1_9ACTN|nr:DUF4145 domain-containing protein [Streptomyces cellostaticus]KUM92898.1 hypothetical protein AQI88_29580 [Streptomyces cellostaticus]GHI04636.1 hypothetical protein Scel_29570 [Streptomyces cellostaticus]